MRYFLDCEFNGFGGALISMALAPEDGGESLYLARHCSNPTPWVRANVLPRLKDAPLPRFVDEPWGYQIKAFLGVETVEIIADWPEDLIHFLNELLVAPGQRVYLRPTLTLINQVDLPVLEHEQGVPHHALWDAISLRDRYQLLLDN